MLNWGYAVTDHVAQGRTAVATETQHALAVLSGVLDRNGQQLSASQARQQALADADHLAVLHAIWTDQTTQAREQHHRDLLAAHLPPGHRREPGHQARWLWRTLRAAELAGLDPGDLLAAAISERDLTGARDLAAVIDARIRQQAAFVLLRPRRPPGALALGEYGGSAYSHQGPCGSVPDDAYRRCDGDTTRQRFVFSGHSQQRRLGARSLRGRLVLV
jgi:hypothetical protein